MSRPARAMEGAVGALETSMAQHRIVMNRRLELESAWLRQAMEMLQERRHSAGEGQENPRSETSGKGNRTSKPTLRRSKRNNKGEEETSDPSMEEQEEQEPLAARTRGRKRKSQVQANATSETEYGGPEEPERSHVEKKTVLSPVEEVDAKAEESILPQAEAEMEQQQMEVKDTDSEETNGGRVSQQRESEKESDGQDLAAETQAGNAYDALPEELASESKAAIDGLSTAEPVSHQPSEDIADLENQQQDGQVLCAESKKSPKECAAASTSGNPPQSIPETKEDFDPQPDSAIVDAGDLHIEKKQENLLTPGPGIPAQEEGERHGNYKTPAAPVEEDHGVCRENNSDSTKHAPYKTPVATVDGLAGQETACENNSEKDVLNFSAEQLKARLKQLKDRTSPIEEAYSSAEGAIPSVSPPQTMGLLSDTSPEMVTNSDMGCVDVPNPQVDGKEQNPQKKPFKVAALQAAELARAAQKAKDEERKLRKEKFEQAKMAQQIEANGTNTASAAQKIQRALEVRAKLAENARLAREEEARKRREAFQKREEEAIARRKAKEEEEMRALEERRKRQEEIRQRQLALEERRRLAMEERERARKAYEEAEQERAAAEEQARLKRQAEKRAEIEKRRKEAEEAARKARLAAEESRERQRMAEAMYKQEQEAIWKAGQNGGDSISPYLGGRVDQENRSPKLASTSAQSLSSLPGKEESYPHGSKPHKALLSSKPPTPQHKRLINPSEYTSYEISPYKEDEDSDDDDERPRKPVPNWARSGPLGIQLRFQEATDPDAIFQAPDRTCDLKDMFQTNGNKRKRDWNRRSSSGNWNDDQLSHAEIMQYRRVMGYIDG